LRPKPSFANNIQQAEKMPPEPKSLKPEEIIAIIIRRRWLVIVPLCIALIIGIYFAITLPKVYRSKTVILVQQQKVPTDFIQSVVSSTTDERISTISQQIMSQTNLEKIIEQFGLFQDAGSQSMYLEDRIENLRKRIQVDVTRGDRGSRRREADSFAISFKGQDPEKVMRIANILATYFIDENLKVREAQAIGTSDFLVDELNTMRIQLEKIEEKLKNYREKNMGSLPEQLETNLRILERLQDSLNDKAAGLRESKLLLLTLEKRFSHEQEVRNKGYSSFSPGESEPQSLGMLQSRLTELQAKYTDRHPDVLRIKKKIAKAEEKLKVEAAATNGEKGKPTAGEQRGAWKTSDDYLLISQIEGTKQEIANLTADSKIVQDKMQFYLKRVEETPKKEQELLSLNRDYQNMSNSYSSLLARKLEAELAVNMEKKQKGEQFYIIDSARLPTKPIEPDMKKLFLMVVGAGLGLGAGLIFLMEYLNNSFKSTEEIEAYLGLPVLVVIPAFVTRRDVIKRKINMVLSLFGVTAAGCLMLGLSALCFLSDKKSMEIISKLSSTLTEVF
jgi:polysaccharide chain length determinant protein (PEP-CTERM system associated)